MNVLVAPDKFRGTATAAQATAAIAGGLVDAGHGVVECPLSDGGEGLIEVFGGANRRATVTGPLGDPVEVPWRLSKRVAIIEMSLASGLEVAGGPDKNDPVAATTAGTGELIRLAVDSGARRVVVGAGGSATTDGGWPALQALGSLSRFKGTRIDVACDVHTLFTDAAEVFGPQKGASPAQVELLTRRLERLQADYLERFGVDLSDVDHSGAAGGLAGGLRCAGAHLGSGFEVVADHVGLESLVADADLVVTGEGLLDDASFNGKVVGGVADMAAQLGTPCVAIVGAVAHDAPRGPALPPVVSLVELVGEQRALADTAAALGEAAGVAVQLALDRLR